MSGFLSRVWTSQPQTFVPAKSKSAYVINAAVMGLAKGASIAFPSTATATKKVNKFGQALSFTTNAITNVYPADIGVIGTGDYTIAILGYTPSVRSTAFEYMFGTGTNNLGLAPRHQSGSYNLTLYSAGGFVNSTISMSAVGDDRLVVSRRGGVVTFYYNDQKYSVANTDNITGTITTLVLNSYTSGGGAGTIIDLNQVVFEKRGWSDREISDWFINPNSIFEPIARYLFAPSVAGVSAALSGTITGANEGDIVAGGKTIILTLTGDTWVTAGATFDAQRQNIIDGLDSAQAEATGWDAVVKALQGVAGVVRTSDTVVTITLDAQATYDITATETITATIPATALTGAGALVASPTFTVTYTAVGSVLPLIGGGLVNSCRLTHGRLI